ncbi:MAG TPA: helix-turn-helix transcriptional regulator [Lachnospiraceae bacterium]|nr:helix-turn-helix transcriptional regulator [Lachnospiraceae bacterium]
MSNLGNKETMGKNIQYYLDLNRKTRQEICSALDLKYSTFTDWINGNTYPRIDKIEKMANYFGIEKSGLIEERQSGKSDYYVDDETKKIAQEIFNDSDMKLLFSLKKSTQSDRLMDYARYLQEIYDKENNL